jgi:hypothetical protein
MKKYLFIVSLFLSTSYLQSNAQSLGLYNYQSVINGTFSEYLHQVTIDVVNESTRSFEVRVRRVVVNEVPGSINYFCWVNCYTPNVSVSLDKVNVNPGDTIRDFFGDYESWGNIGATSIKYCFYDDSNEADSTCALVTFDINESPANIATFTANKPIAIGNAFPNPANDKLNIPYHLASGKSAILNISDMLGKTINTISLQAGIQLASVDVSALHSGIYFYSIVSDGKVYETKKFVVAEN